MLRGYVKFQGCSWLENPVDFSMGPFFSIYRGMLVDPRVYLKDGTNSRTWKIRCQDS